MVFGPTGSGTSTHRVSRIALISCFIPPSTMPATLPIRIKSRKIPTRGGRSIVTASSKSGCRDHANCHPTRSVHTCPPRWSCSERVWDVDVHVFALEGHPNAQKAYAWSVPFPGSERRRFYAVLPEGPVDSPEKAVRARPSSGSIGNTPHE